MPVYTFRCRKCRKEIEVEHSFAEPHPELCGCGGDLQRVFQKPHIVYKGAGFYSVDRRLDPNPLDDDD
jgi:putative FmdB family regulatory protein